MDRLLGEQGLKGEAPAARQELERRMEERRRQEEDGGQRASIRRGWCLGDEELRRELLARVSGKVGEHHAGELRRQSAQAKAEGIIVEELKALGWTESELGGAASERGWQAAVGSAAAAGDDAADEVDRGATAPGNMEECQRAVADLEAKRRKGTTPRGCGNVIV